MSSRSPRRLLLLCALYGVPSLIVGWYSYHRYVDSQLASAVQDHDLSAVEHFLSLGANPNLRVKWPQQPGPPKDPLLHRALGPGTQDIALALIRAGARTEDAAYAPRSFLQCAVDSGLPKVVREMLDRSPSAAKSLRFGSSYVDPRGAREMYLLLRERGAHISIADAVRNHDLEYARGLIASGADPNEPVDWSMTNLITACSAGDVATVKALIDAGARVDATDRQGRTALSHVVGAYSSPRPDIARLLIERGASVNAPDLTGFTPLLFATMAGNVEMVRLLLDHGADPSARVAVKEMSGATYEASAASIHSRRRQAIYDLLKSHGARITLPETLQNGDVALARRLLKSGADPNQRDGYGRPALVHAIEHPAVLEELLHSGARIDERDRTGWTALMHCIMNGRADVGELLIRRGADLYVKDRHGKPVLDWFAHFPKYKPTIERLEACQAATKVASGPPIP